MGGASVRYIHPLTAGVKFKVLTTLELLSLKCYNVTPTAIRGSIIPQNVYRLSEAVLRPSNFVQVGYPRKSLRGPCMRLFDRSESKLYPEEGVALEKK